MGAQGFRGNAVVASASCCHAHHFLPTDPSIFDYGILNSKLRYSITKLIQQFPVLFTCTATPSMKSLI